MAMTENESAKAVTSEESRHWNWEAISSVSTAFSAILVSAGLLIATWQLAQTQENTQISRRMDILELQASIRDRWIDWYDRTRSLELENYPGNDHKYSEQERRLIREYWSIVVFHEFAVIHEFQNGLLRNLWPQYESYIVDALSNEAQAEEWFYFSKTSKRKYQIPLRAEMDRIIRKHFPDLDPDKILARRSSNTLQTDR